MYRSIKEYSLEPATKCQPFIQSVVQQWNDITPDKESTDFFLTGWFIPNDGHVSKLSVSDHNCVVHVWQFVFDTWQRSERMIVLELRKFFWNTSKTGMDKSRNRIVAGISCFSKSSRTKFIRAWNEKCRWNTDIFCIRENFQIFIHAWNIAIQGQWNIDRNKSRKNFFLCTSGDKYCHKRELNNRT